MKTLRETINDIKKLFSGYNTSIKLHKVNDQDSYLSGFIKLPESKYIYVSCIDIRFCNNYRKEILFRTAKNLKDYSGGFNNFFDLDNLDLTSQKIINQIYGSE